MKGLKLFFLLGMSFFLFGTSAFAAEKEYAVEVKKEYSSAKISVTLPDDGGEYEVKVISPDRKEYDGTLITDTLVEFIINDQIATGSWKVKVEREDAVVVSGEGMGEEGGESVPAVEDEIQGVSIKFEGHTEKILDVTKDIVVATDIVGLQMYFKDDNFVAEWSDTTCGNVNIEVTDEKSMESLDKTTVQGQYYELPLDPATEAIVVKIVPSTSASERGADKSYTYKFINNPDATVTYEDIEITNKDSIKVNVLLNQPYSVLFIGNGKEISKTSVLQPGEYNFDLPTEVGDNNYLTYIIDDVHNMRSTAGYVEKDVIAPVLQLSKEYVQINTQDENITIEGKVEDYETFTINDAEANVEGDHTFSYIYSLKEGMNVIDIVATDRAGNVSQYTATVNRIIPVEKPVPWVKIIAISAFAVLIGFYIWDVIKKHYGSPSERRAGRGEKRGKNKPVTPYDEKKRRNGLISDLLSLFVPLIIIIIIVNFVLGITVIQSASMEPTLMTGNTVFINRLAYKTGQEIRRGDIIFFRSEEYGENYGKRVIGIPGDVVEFKDGYVVINGQYTDESSYLSEDVETNSLKVFTVPAGCYFVLGDNRENSNDSRYWQNPYVAREDIQGRYMGQIDFSFQRDIFHAL